MMLRGLDLFSGIGGITHGLRGIVTPVAYVEKNKDARDFLRKKHPDITVFEDVCTLDATEFKGMVDIITGGWPCTGFSVAGKGAGFEHDGSGLFTEIIRLAKECDPSYLFLENSHVLSRSENISVIVKAFDEIGYDCRWVTCHATCVEAKHQRHRWFCLVTKRGIDVNISTPNVDKFDWNLAEPPRQIENHSVSNKNILGFMGNAVVPDQVRYAFNTLVHMDPSTLKLKKNESNGSSIGGEITTFVINHPKTEPVNIKIYPRPNEASFAVRCDVTKVLTKPKIAAYWATPTYSLRTAPKTPRTLTKRCSVMMSAQVSFCEGGVHGYYINSDWVRWLMGFPAGYFNVDVK